MSGHMLCMQTAGDRAYDAGGGAYGATQDKMAVRGADRVVGRSERGNK